jgi:hypothetical protein
LVEKTIASRHEEGRLKVDTTYRFGPPAEEYARDGVCDVQNSTLV